MSASTTPPTIQQRMRAKLEKVGIPYKQIQVFGSQIIVTSHCMATARRWASLLAHFAAVKGVKEVYDDAKENKGTCLRPTKIKVCRTWATIE